ncbi:hypothetical protein B0H66DRAFT_326076 [Apodospora peruviana]|uniref:Gag1-like clamp domain-containing protein n=1 Tax=Apodospora peruviana TaxID=516989 RepID=A0AAE0HXZ1_9PEZI|nr:hypothetical protein B0H66DRAFT_326076 [Apodospora peruviana]
MHDDELVISACSAPINKTSIPGQASQVSQPGPLFTPYRSSSAGRDVAEPAGENEMRADATTLGPLNVPEQQGGLLVEGDKHHHDHHQNLNAPVLQQPPADSSVTVASLCLPVSQLGLVPSLPQHPQDIIPPPGCPGRVTPHEHQQHQQLPAPPSYIKSAPAQSREATGGDHDHAPSASTAIALETPTPPNMIFSDLYKSPRSPFNKLRHSIPHLPATTAATDLEADLVSRDKTRQKEAVRKFLAEKVRNDWEFVWPPASPAPAHTEDQLATPTPDSSTPPAVQNGVQITKIEDDNVPVAPPTFDEDAPRDPGEEADSESDTESVYSTVSEDQTHFRPRVEWTSDISDDEIPHPAATSPFRFDTPDAVGTAVQSSIQAKRARRRRAVRDEVGWNPGLACFEARRNAWTGAKTVRVKPKPATPASPSSVRRIFWRHNRTGSTASQNAAVTSPVGSPPSVSSPLSPTTTHTSHLTTTTPPPSEPDSSHNGSKGSAIGATTSRDSSHQSNYAVETLLPVPAPLLPAQNPMRASVTPAIYPSLYDKIVVHSLQPSCPVNLGDMLRACVVGWKRDGEWPPKSAVTMAPMPTPAELAAMRQQRKMQQQQQRKADHARKASTATNGSTSRRLSFVGFLSGGGGGSAKVEQQQQPPQSPPIVHEKDAAGNGNGGKGDTHSDEAANGTGSAGKGIRRSLQKVFSLGHGQHGHIAAPTGSTPLSPTATANTVKEVTAVAG